MDGTVVTVGAQPEIERLQAVRTFSELMEYLRVELGWPIDEGLTEDEAFFDYSAAEVGLDEASAVKIERIRRLRPPLGGWPWGIFFIDFRPGKLPITVLRRILRALVVKKRAASDKQQWLMGDLLFISILGEAGHRGINLAHFTDDGSGDGRAALRVVDWDEDDAHFHMLRTTDELHCLRWPSKPTNHDAWRETWSKAFRLKPGQVAKTAAQLATQMAALAKLIRARVNAAMEIESAKGPLSRMYQAFKQVLVSDLTPDGFADMYAQTITYGLFAARRSRPMGVTAETARDMVPNTNPFLRDLLAEFTDVGGATKSLDFDELGIDALVEVLNQADMDAIIADFDDKNPDEDPVIHFYVDFVHQYDKEMKVQRGIFFTPRPVVSFIVRSVDELLRTDFGLKDGLADTTTWGEMVKRNRGLSLPEGATPETPFVQILDPAVGTGTFLVEVIDLIHRTMMAKWQRQGHLPMLDIPDLWNDYVAKHLLPRLYGFELMMAPYAIAHMKIGLKLEATGYRFTNEERLRIFLTNTLEEPRDIGAQFKGMAPALAHEAQAVNEVKRRQRFTVVIGNPPYSKSLSNNPWIISLVDDFKIGLNEKKSDLNREEWKFLRFAYHNVELAGAGTVGLVINNAFLSAPTHRAMRRYLLEHSGTLAIVDLHGDSRKRETAPDGSFDENIFEIQQGVCIVLGWRTRGKQHALQLRRTDLFGAREDKYRHLRALSLASTEFEGHSPQPPQFLFKGSAGDTASPYAQWVSIRDLFSNSNTGIQTKNDALFVDVSSDVLCRRMSDVLGNISTHRAAICKRYGLTDSAGWRISHLDGIKFDKAAVQKLLYKPFDQRFIYYNTKALGRARHSTMRHMLAPNLGLITTRQVTQLPFCHSFVSRWPIEEKTGSHDRTTQLFPLYVYEPPSPLELANSGRANDHAKSALCEAFTSQLSEDLGFKAAGSAQPSDRNVLTPEQVFFYVYSILNSPSYRDRFGHELMGDFARIPLIRDRDLFLALALLGQNLVTLHLMESSKLARHITTYAGPAHSDVEKVSYDRATVWLDKAQKCGFRGVPKDIWNFHIGGYQVCEKWLKDRKGRVLTAEDIEHYQRIVVALSETIRIMGEIDEVIEEHGGWPGAFATAGKGGDA
jgi:type I restriction-modification system DNA methylase subunit